MTIKKITALSAALSVLLVGNTFAGELKVDSNASVMASELVIGQDYNGTANDGLSIDLNTSYHPALNAGVNTGKALITFDGARLRSLVGDVVLYNLDTNKTVGNNPQFSGKDNQKLTFDINDTIDDYNQLRLTSDNSDGDSARENNATVVLDVLNGSSVVTTTFQLLDNVDKPLDTSNATNVITLVKEWDVSIENQFNAKIDASKSFAYFTTNTSTSGGTVDTAGVHIEHNSKVKIGTGAPTLNVVVNMDQNISTAGTLASNVSATPTIVATSTGYQTDENLTSFTSTSDYNLTYTSSTKAEIPETVFTATASILKFVNNASYNKTYLADADLGAWEIYGYKAQIPNVLDVAGKFSTNIKFTNRSTLGVGVYFTLIDQNGVVVQLDSDNDGLAALDAGKTQQYKAADLIKLASAKDSTFDGSKSISVEVSIPTTPNKVYGFASFKNVTLGQFKDLPIYNTSTMTY